MTDIDWIERIIGDLYLAFGLLGALVVAQTFVLILTFYDGRSRECRRSNLGDWETTTSYTWTQPTTMTQISATWSCND